MAVFGIGAPPAQAAAKTYEVTSKVCTGPNSLAAAVDAANAHPGADTIRFKAGLVIDAASCPPRGTDPNHVPSDYYLARVTESVVFEGNGATLQGHLSWIGPSGTQSFGKCPKSDPLTVVVATTPGFIQSLSTKPAPGR